MGFACPRIMIDGEDDRVASLFEAEAQPAAAREEIDRARACLLECPSSPVARCVLVGREAKGRRPLHRYGELARRHPVLPSRSSAAAAGTGARSWSDPGDAPVQYSADVIVALGEAAEFLHHDAGMSRSQTPFAAGVASLPGAAPQPRTYVLAVVLTRSQQMARIRARHTSPERLLRRLLWQHGLRYRLHARTEIGRPDIVFPGPRVAVFVDGCFWHGCPEHYVRPRSSNDFWAQKLQTNVKRDIRQTRELESLGWRVCRVWEHDVFEHPHRVVRRIVSAVHQPRWRPSTSWRALRVVGVDDEAGLERWFLVDLRDCSMRRTVVRRRTTHKWRRADPAAASR